MTPAGSAPRWEHPPVVRAAAAFALRGLGLVIDVAVLALAVGLAGYAGLAGVVVVVAALRALETSVITVARRRLQVALPRADLRPEDRHRIDAVLGDLCGRAGHPVPPLVVVERIGSDRFNAAAAPGAEGGCLLVTPAAVEALTDTELRAVCAHELAHLWRPDDASTMVVGSVGGIVATAAYQMGLAIALWGTGLHVAWTVASGPELIAVLIVVPYASRIIARLLARREEYRADAVAASLCDDPADVAIAVYELELGGIRDWRERHHLAPLDPDDRPSVRSHFTSTERRARLESLAHAHSPLLRTLLVALAAGGDHPALFRRARRLLRALDRPVMLPMPLGPPTGRPPLGAA
jgi:heat shock protein HtpX